MKKKLVILCLMLFFVSVAYAQTAPRPYIAEFTPSAEHNAIENGVPVVSNYTLAIYAPGALTPISPVVNLNKPTPNAAGKIAADVTSTMVALPASVNCNTAATIAAAPPYSATCYVGKVTAVGPGGFSESLPSPPFTLVPRAPTGPTGLAIKGQ